jgi:hypothetical protein
MRSAERNRILRPCTLMIVQKLHSKGQPRPQSSVPKLFEATNFLMYLG